MAITAKFQADFSSFFDAVQKAEVELRSFETGAGKVEKSLNRMVDNFSGRKIVQEATLTARAVEQIGGVSALTEAEVKRLGQSFADAATKAHAMGIELPKSVTDFKAALDAAKPEEVSGFFSDLSGEVAKTAAGFVSAQAIIGAFRSTFGAATDLVRDSIRAYGEAEAAQTKLTTALRTHGTATPQVVSQFNELAATFQKTTIYSDDLITEMQALLVQVGDVMPSQMKMALQAAMNLASGLGIDLQTATTLVAKAAAGHVEALGRYGIAVTDARGQSKEFSDVLDSINSKFGGQAAAQMETYAGRVKQVANAWENVKEALGKAIVEDPLVVAALNRIAKAANDADQAATNATGGVTRFIAAFAPEPIGSFVKTVSEAQALMQELDKMTAAALSKPGPFQHILEGLNENTNRILAEGRAALAEWSKEIEKDKEAAEKFKAAMVELSSAGTTVGRILETLNGDVVEGIKFYLDAGVAQEHIATAYGVTATQVKAVAQEVENAKKLTEAWDAVNEVFFKRAIELWKQGQIELGKLTAQTNDLVIANLKAKDALATQQGFSVSGNPLDQMSQAQRDYQNKLAALQQQAAAHPGIDISALEEQLFREFQAAFDKAAMAANTLATAHDNASHAGAVVADSFGRVSMASSSAADAFAQFTGSTLPTLSSSLNSFLQSNNALAQAYGARFKDSFNLAPQPSLTGFGGYRASGGSVMSGKSYMVGERGPELFTPTASGSIWPNGGGSTVNVNVSGLLLSTDPRARAEIEKLVNSAVVSALQRTGWKRGTV